MNVNNFNKSLDQPINLSSKYISRKTSINTNMSRRNTEPSDTINFKTEKKNMDIDKQLLTVLKMRLSIENIKNYTDEDLAGFIKNNLSLIDLEHVEVTSINKFIDELVRIIATNSTINENTRSDFGTTLIDEWRYNTTNNFNNSGYHPRPTSEEHFKRKRTIEVVLEKPKGIKKGPLKFNLFDKDKGKKIKSPVFHNDFNKDYNRNSNVFDLKQLESQIIDEVLKKKGSNCNFK